MAEKPLKPGASEKKPRPAESLVSGIKKNEIELEEEELNKVSGGDSSGPLLYNANPKHIKEGLL